MIWARMLAYITETLDQELLLRNEYLAAENRILRVQIKGRLLLSDAEKAPLAEIAHRLGWKALEELAAVAKPDTLLAWYRKLIASSSTDRSFANPGVVPELTRKPSGWCRGWVAGYWSWWRMMLPFLAFLGHNAVYLLAGFLCFCRLKHEEDEEEKPTTVQKHSREGYNLAALLLIYLFWGNLSRRVEASKDKAGRGSGRVRGDSRWWSCLGC